MGDFTYQKGDLKSQIDFVLIDAEGKKLINKFCVMQEDWVISDHKHIFLDLSITLNLPAISLYKRSLELNFDYMKPSNVVNRFKGQYDYSLINDYLLSHRDTVVATINDCIYRNDVDGAVQSLDAVLQKAHKIPGAYLKPNKQKYVLNSMNK